MNKISVQSFQQTALAAALLLELTTAAQAATITVDNVNCTLANAINAANTDTAGNGCAAGNGVDVIELPSNSTITLTEPMPAIINSVTINAHGSTIVRDANAADFSVIQLGSLAAINNQPTIVLNDVTVTGGSRGNNYGGGINAINSTLILNDSIITNNMGGAITLSGSIDSVINRTIISDNQSSPGGTYYGGALSIASGTLTIQQSTITNNTSNSGLGGAGIYASDYGGPLNLSIINSTISNNATTYDGAGIIHYVSATPTSSLITIQNSTLINNQSGGEGGGIYNDSADFIISQSLIAGNNATLNGNEILSTGGSITLNDYNLIGFNNNNGSSGVTLGATDTVPAEPNLSDIIDTTLADNGGATPTHNLAEGSPAIDAIAPANCATAVDQTGHTRGNDGDGDTVSGCDIGAVEFQLIVDLIFSDGFEIPSN